MSRMRTLVFIVLSVISALLLTISGASAQQEDRWSAWLYDQEQGAFIEVSPAGETLQQIDVPRSSGYDWYSFYAAASPDGQAVAYGEAAASDNNRLIGQILIYDVNEDRMLVTYPLTPSPEVITTDTELFNAATQSLTFDDSGDRVAFGYAYRFDPADTNRYQWQIVVLDISQPAPAPSYTLRSEDASAALGTQADALYYITNLQFSGSVVQFTLLPVFIHQNLSPVTAHWNTQTGGLEVLDVEPITAVNDEVEGMRLSLIPASDAGSGMGGTIYHAVALIDTASGQETTLLETSADGSVMSAKFVQNAERVAAFAIEDASGVIELVILDLEGNIVRSFGDMAYSELWGTPDGFLYRDADTQSLISVNLREGGERTTLHDAMNTIYSIIVVPSEG